MEENEPPGVILGESFPNMAANCQKVLENPCEICGLDELEIPDVRERGIS